MRPVAEQSRIGRDGAAMPARMPPPAASGAARWQRCQHGVNTMLVSRSGDSWPAFSNGLAISTAGRSPSAANCCSHRQAGCATAGLQPVRQQYGAHTRTGQDHAWAACCQGLWHTPASRSHADSSAGGPRARPPEVTDPCPGRAAGREALRHVCQGRSLPGGQPGGPVQGGLAPSTGTRTRQGVPFSTHSTRGPSA